MITHRLLLALALKMLKRGGKTNVMSVTVLPPTRDRMAPKLGILRAMNNSSARVDVRKTHLFQVNSEKNKGLKLDL